MAKEHKWEPEIDGAERCVRQGCHVRRYRPGRSWQTRKGAHWRKEHRDPIPPCDGKEP